MNNLDFILVLISAILIGIIIGFVIFLGVDTKYGLEISKDTKINVNNVKYRVIDLGKVQDNKIILTVNNLSGE